MSGLYGIQFYVVSIYCIKYDNRTIASTLCSWESSCLITVELAIKIDDYHVDMVCLVILFSLWYRCHGVISFGNNGMFCGVCSLSWLC